MSFLNGLSAMGASVAQFAGSAGLEAQKADLAQQAMVLADQLATTREHVGRVEAGDIAATAAEKEHTFKSGEGVLDRQSAQTIAQTHAGATLGAAGIAAASARYSSDQAAATARMQDTTTRYRTEIESKGLYAQIAAAEPIRQAQLLEAQQKTLAQKILTDNAADLRTAHQQLQATITKPDADPAEVARLKLAVTSLETSASTEAATTTAAATMYRTDQESVQHINTQLVAATAALNNPAMNDTDRKAQQALVDSLKQQLAGANRAMAYSGAIVQGRVANATGNPPAPGPATNPNRPPLSTFSAPPAGGLINGAPQ